MVAGENFGILDDQPPHSNHFVCTSHVADQVERAGLSWKSYQERIGAPCGTEDNYPYLPKHNPFVYFDDINGWNARARLPTGALRVARPDEADRLAEWIAGFTRDANLPRPSARRFCGALPRGSPRLASS